MVAKNIEDSIKKFLVKKNLKADRRLVVFLFFIVLATIFWFLNQLDEEYVTEIPLPVRYTNFPEEKITFVKKAIITHLPNGQPTTNEGVLLHDADLLDFLGAIGITRLSIAAWDWFGAKDMTEVIKTLKKYREVYNSLVLDESKKLASNKTIVMDMFIKQLEDELKV